MRELRSAEHLLEELRAAVLRDPLVSAQANPRFSFEIGWCKDYDELLALKCQSATQVGEIVARAITSRRVLIHARGGGAKTVILRRLVREHLPEGVLPIWVDLKKWTVADYDMWGKLTTLPVKLDFLLSHLAVPNIGVALLEALPARVGKMVFVDGLNEIRTGIATEMLEALHALVRVIPASAVIISDRLVRRTLKDLESWQLATILPLNEGEVRHQLTERFGSAALYENADAQTRALLAVPYFLDAALREGHLATSGPQVHEEYFRHHVLTKDELAKTARAAFEAYSENNTRSFSAASFRTAVGEATFEKLCRETLIVHDDIAYFDHHLKHDYLAAVQLAADLKLWNEDTFNPVTFSASSFEVLAMALDLLETEAAADAFVRAVYDWNPYGAAYSVAEGRYRGRSRVSPSMELILIAVIADRQWDPILATAQRSRDALRLFGTPEAEQLLATPSPEAVSAFVSAAPKGNEDFERWRNLFTRASGTPTKAGDIGLLTEDSVIGWTASNVLKRLRLSMMEQLYVRKLTRTGSRVVRWRAVHTLGAFPSRSNARALLDVLETDEYRWARYGAIRSLVELAARGDASLRQWIMGALVDKADEIVNDDPIVRELQNAVLIDPERAPKGWMTLVIEMLGKIRVKEHSGEKRDRWEDVAYKVKAAYEPDSQD